MYGSSFWYITLCALSVTLGALSYNLMANLSTFFHLHEEREESVAVRVGRAPGGCSAR